MEKTSAVIKIALEETASQKEVLRKLASKKRSDVTKARNKACALYRGSVPEHLLRYLWDRSALVIRASEDAENDEASVGASGKLVDNFPVVRGGQQHSFKGGQPAYFPESHEEGVGQLIQSLPEHIGVERIAQAEKDVLRTLGQQGAEQAFKRLQPKGQPQDTLETYDWVPEEWKASKILPTALTGFGAPQLLICKPGTSVSGPGDWPVCGVGQFIIMVKGSATLALWSAKSTKLRGSSVDGQLEFLFKELASSTFNSWADENLRFVCMEQGSAAWVPYGWFGVFIARPSEHAASTAMLQPYVNQLLASQCDEWGEVSQFVASQIEGWVRRGLKVWQTIGPSSLEWLRARPSAASFISPRKQLKDSSLAAQEDSQVSVSEESQVIADERKSAESVSNEVENGAGAVGVSGAVSDEKEDDKKDDVEEEERDLN